MLVIIYFIKIDLSFASNPLLVLDPYILSQPAHRKHTLDTNGGASIGVSYVSPNLSTRPQGIGFSTNMPFIRDPSDVQSGWGFGVSAFLSKANDSRSLKSYDSQTFEVSVGRSTMVPLLETSVGLQGFLETGFNVSSLNFDNEEAPTNASIPSPRRSFFIRLGAMSNKEGQGLVTYKPYVVDHSLNSSFVFPIDLGETIMSFTYRGQMGCGLEILRCGFMASFTNFSQTITIAGFDEPSKWLSAGPTLTFYFLNRKALLKTAIIWDQVKTSANQWVTSAAPTANVDVALIF